MMVLGLLAVQFVCFLLFFFAFQTLFPCSFSVCFFWVFIYLVFFAFFFFLRKCVKKKGLLYCTTVVFFFVTVSFDLHYC